MKVCVFGAGAVGGYFGLRASSKWNSAFDDGHCNSNNECTREGQDLTDSARSAAVLANVFVGAGVVLVGGGAALYFTLYGYLIIAGKVQQPFGDFLVKSAKIALIGALALNAGNYLALVVETLKGLEAALAAAVGSGGTGTIYGTLDATLGQGVTEPVGIVTSVGQQRLGSGERIDQQRRPFVVAHLPFAE